MHTAPVIRQLPGCRDLLAVHGRDPAYYPFLLDSTAHGTPNARYTILFAAPAERLTLDAGGRLSGEGIAPQGNDFLAALDAWWRVKNAASEPVRRGEEIPFRGGWFLYLGYELAGQVEPSLRLPPRSDADPLLPTACAVRIPAAIICDHEGQTTSLVVEGDDAAHAGLLERLAEDVAAVGSRAGSLGGGNSLALYGGLCEAPSAAYLASVGHIKRYIDEGDVFQVNLSQAWRLELPRPVDPADIYSRLCATNPAPFAALVRLPGGSIVSSSPERLVRVRNGIVEARPIAGTRPRGADTSGDADLSAELLADSKERAEHIMLIDLERNDLGRICRPGSVVVNELMALESYAHVHHIVSNVCGRLQPAIAPGDVIRAVFPGGTITGCPKVRCMEIIAELEGEARGAYTGSVGYLNHDGSMDLNILIRTLSVDDRHLTLRAGAGIVADSELARELDETRAKARGVLLALQDG